MATSLKEVLQSGISREDASRIPANDLKLIAEGRDNEVSRSTLQYIKAAKEDAGALEYLDVGTSLGGALGGAALGTAILPGIGTVVGGVLGGAAGAFGGEVAEDLLAGRKLNIGLEEGGASREALSSLMWDGIFLGAGKVVRPIARTLGIDPGRMLGALRSEEKAFDIDKIADVPIDTPAGVLQLNTFLTSKDGGLTLTQTGAAGPLVRFAEGLANIGTLSNKAMADRIQQNADIFEKEFTSYYDSAIGLDPESVGETLITLVKAGDKALIAGYGAELAAITERAAGKKVSTQPIIDAINSIPKKNRTMIETNLSDQTMKALSDRESVLRESYSLIDPRTGKTFSGAKNADVQALIEYQKRFTNMVNDAKPSLTNPNADANLYRELVASERKIKSAISKTLSDIDPDLSRAYRELNVWFGKSRNSLKPIQLGNKIAQAANAEAYTALGKIITTASDAGQVSKLFKSIETAFDTMKTTKTAVSKEGQVKSFEEAQKLMRQAFLAQRVKGDANVLSNTSLTGFINDFKDPAKNKILQTVFKEDYGKIKFLAGGLSKIVEEAPSNLLTLAIRGREVSAGANLIGALGGAGTAIGAGGAAAGGLLAGGLGAAAGAVALFGLPVVFSKIALNKKASQRLLRLAQDADKFQSRSPELIASQVAKVLEALSEEDRKEIAALGLN